MSEAQDFAGRPGPGRRSRHRGGRQVGGPVDAPPPTVALVAGEVGTEIAGERKTVEALMQAGFPARLFVMPGVAHLYSENMEQVMADALAAHGVPGVIVERQALTTLDNAREEADGYFLSCTNTTQIEAIEELEAALGKPVVSSNQAVLWGAVKRLRSRLGGEVAMPRLGRLMAM